MTLSEPHSHKDKAAPDWERIEADYRAGLLSVREIAASQGVSHVAIAKRAKRDCWQRDLSAKILAKAESLVTSQAVTSLVTSKLSVTDKMIVEANAQAIANIRLGHRSDIHRARTITNRLLLELESQTGADNVALLQEMGEIMRAPDDRGQDRRNDLYQKIISLPERSKTMKSLADSMRVLVDMERQAYNMDDPATNALPPGAAGHIPQAVAVMFISPPVRAIEDDEE